MTSVQKGGESAQVPLESGEDADLGFLASGGEQASGQPTQSLYPGPGVVLCRSLVTFLPPRCLVHSLGNSVDVGEEASDLGEG